MPEGLRPGVERRVADLFADGVDTALPESKHWNSLPAVWACSEFIARVCIVRPEMLLELIGSGDLDKDYPEFQYVNQLRSATESETEEAAFAQKIRRFRQREMVRLAWRDIAKLAPLETTLRELSLLAEACVQVASRFAQIELERLHGAPKSQDGEALDLVVLGMGKLGAYELNYSSDIDLIYTFVEEGETSGGERRPLSNSEFFIKLGQRLTRLLDENTVDGFVFRVDTRLRPFGNSGQLALSFDAMETYYEQHGREWERYAMIKARVISGNVDHGVQLMKRLKPFVYRRYIDFSAFESLREMKQLIVNEVKRKGLEDNIKIGSGGIREIEFIGQAFQLIRGGREQRLQKRSILYILDMLGQMGMLPEYVVQQLCAAYEFLRLSENRIQAYADKQTHLLPQDVDGKIRLAFSMGFADWESYYRKLADHRQVVHEHFEQIFSAPQAEEQSESDDQQGAALKAMWYGRMSDADAAQLLQELGFEDGAQAFVFIKALHNSHALKALSQRARTRLDRLMPLVLSAISKASNAQNTLALIVNLLEKIARRSVYVALLIEHPMALSQLVRLVSMSPWVAEQITRNPVLMDELLDPRRLYEPMKKEELAQELSLRMASVDEGDLEAQMDVLRQFRHANVLRVAASQLTDAMPLAKVSDHLTFIAEVVIKEVLNLSQAQLQQRHGRPKYVVDAEEREAGFAIIAYGKMGGWELGFGSDLDVVFLHDSRGEEQYTDGQKCLDNSVYFARLGQKIIHMLNTQTSNGVLYEVDTRLRPSGQSGLLVSSLNAFLEYQQKQAWTWEHQALIRARWVAGSASIGEAFNEIRRKILCQQREHHKLATEVQEMRTRMRDALGSKNSGVFDIKQDAGGITDIEFIIQFLVLRWAHEYPELVDWQDNLRIIETLERIGKLSSEDAALLSNTYLSYRHAVHELTLSRASKSVTQESNFQESRDAVTRIWNSVLESG